MDLLGEAVTQLGCAALLVLALLVLAALPSTRRVLVRSLLAFAAVCATHGSMTNWWGVPVAYPGGMSGNLVAGCP
ncbi:MAG: hypothetical protein INH41_08925 [Myxococcaceae bacterium]|nr:hypothetical protein [Myxococcaceae bacterium]MCA3012507.1 hypothetical protein [Myxococcaceae bacterium]